MGKAYPGGASLIRHSLAAFLSLVLLAGSAPAEEVAKAASDRAVALSAATLKEFAAGKATAVYARFDEVMRGTVTKADFAAFMQQNAAQSGAITKPRTHAVTLYRQRELLVAVDWSGRTTGGGAACGFFLWSGADTPDPKIRRFEVTYLPAGLAKSQDPRKTAVLMAQLHCGPALIKDLTGVTVNLN